MSKSTINHQMSFLNFIAHQHHISIMNNENLATFEQKVLQMVTHQVNLMFDRGELEVFLANVPVVVPSNNIFLIRSRPRSYEKLYDKQNACWNHCQKSNHQSNQSNHQLQFLKWRRSPSSIFSYNGGLTKTMKRVPYALTNLKQA